ncbi:nucleoside recognition domain-containing protein [uncultured Arcticibacterium sp.]|uniref:nucleoside recognition domain-containing protein n=1 Tax=uncultured Arcticibacterium sp. TaxID=2173042 RepID=UPI0030F4F31E
MVLNYVWSGFFIIAMIVALFKYFILNDQLIFETLVAGIFDSAKTGFEISLALTGIMTLFLGILKIGEAAGAIRFMSRIVGPFFNKLFPEVPKGHPAHGQMIMNFSANMLNLDNAATPFGLKAMESLQELNPNKDTASNSQIMFLVLQTSGLTLIPINIMTYRASMGASDPSDVFIPLLISTYFATVISLIVLMFKQKIKIWDKTIIGWIGGISAFILLLLWYLSKLSQGEIEGFSKVYSNLILFSVIVVFIIGGLRKKIDIFDTFIEGAKEGFQVAVKIIPYLVGMLVAISVLRNSGVLNAITDALAFIIGSMGIDTRFVEALPVAIMRPLSGSGARGLMLEAMAPENGGPDSFIGRLVCIFQGTTDTTFYIVALYFGSVGVTKVRYAIQYGLLADFIGIVAAILIGYMFFA